MLTMLEEIYGMFDYRTQKIRAIRKGLVCAIKKA
jgi:hypothetical protein